MDKKKRPRKDSIERMREKNIQKFSKQSQYFQTLLTESLPKYYGGSQDYEQKTNENIVQAKRIYFGDSPSKRSTKVSLTSPKGDESPLKLRKTFTKKQDPFNRSTIKTPPPSTKSVSNRINSPQKNIQPKQQQNEEDLHPYSILLHFQKLQKQMPNEQKKVYQYRKIHDPKDYTEKEVDQMIEQLLNQQKGDLEKLSVTDQFILSRFFDLKIRKYFENLKEKQKLQKRQALQKKPIIQPLRAKKDDPNPQLMKAFKQIKFVWDFYQLKLSNCPDLVKGNEKDQKVYEEIKKLSLDLNKLSEQINRQKQNAQKEAKLSNKKSHFHNKMTQDMICKKVKAIMRRFKEIILAEQ